MERRKGNIDTFRYDDDCGNDNNLNINLSHLSSAVCVCSEPLHIIGYLDSTQ